MYRRNSLKSDPFGAAKQYIQLRLQTLQQAILAKFKYGPEREMMRVTIKQLLNVEPSLQGKINRLMAVIQEIQICGNNYFETVDSECELPNNKRYSPPMGQNKDAAVQYSFMSPKIYEKTINLSQSQKYRNDQLIDRYESIKHYPNEVKAYQIPYVYSSVNRKRQFTDNSVQSLYSSKSSNNLTMPNFLNKSDSINQQDLFSFRTQDAASPLKRSKESPMRKRSQPFQQNPYQYLYNQQKSRSKSQKKSDKKSEKKSDKKSEKKSQKGSNSRKNSRLKEEKSLKKGINYDGKGLNFRTRSLEAKKKVKKQSSDTNGLAKYIKEAEILKKIQRRIKCSKCVVEQIEHSNSIADHLYVVNRYKQENQLRKKLSNQLQNFVNNSTRWR